MKGLLLLRGVAIAIALAALIDPACHVVRLQPARVGIVVAESPTLDLPASSSGRATRRDEALKIRDRLVAALSPVAVTDTQPSSDQQGLVVIGDRLPARLPVGTDVMVTTIDVGRTLAPNVAAGWIDVPPTVRVGARVAITVTVDGLGVSGQASTVLLHSGPLRLGSQTHTWAPGESQSTLTFDLVPWKSGPLPLRATVMHSGPEVTTVDNVVDAATMAEDTAARVLVLDARPSWASRFVVRALEQEPQCRVTTRTSLGRGIDVGAGGSGGLTLTRATLDDYDVVVVSSPDAEAAAVLDWLDVFMRVRGGAVLVLADETADLVALRRWWTLDVRAQASASPVTVTGAGQPGVEWRATEFAAPRQLAPTVDVLASTVEASPRPVVVARAVGLGRLVANTALDGWRFRGDDGSRFGEFWRGVVVGLAADAVLPVTLAASASAARPGDTVGVRVSVRRGVAPAGDDTAPVVHTPLAGAIERVRTTLWPTARDGVFECTVALAGTDAGGGATVIAGPSPARAAVRVAAGVRPPDVARLPLAWLAGAHGGTAADATSIEVLAAELRRQLEAARSSEIVVSWPMRSPWWMVPFAGLLGIEWVVRRQRGWR